jgi:CubicO group peptidase (beta-lactamase class C family)
MIRLTIIAILFISSFVTFGQDINSKVDSILQKYEQPNAPGLGIGIIKDGKIIYSKGIGLATLEYNIKNSDSTVFSIASIAKQFTAACAWALIKENKLSLDDDIRTFLPELPEKKDIIKIRHLLNHTSGFRDYNSSMYLAGFDYDKEYYDNQMVYNIACKQKKMTNLPGEKVLYGNTPFNLLTLIIERISNKNLHEFAKEKLFIPLGMYNTLVRTENNTIIKNKAVGYQKTKDSYIQLPRTQISYGAGSMGSTIKDMALWINMLNGDNAEFIELSRFLTTLETLPSGEKAKYARGVMVDDYKGLKTVSHSGYGWGGQSQLITIPEKKIGVILMANLESINPTPISYDILDLFISKPEAKKEIATNKFKVKPKDFKLFAGQYKEINSDMKMEILFENDTLKSKGARAKNPIALKGFKKNKFHRINSESVKYDFTKNAKYDLVISFGGTPFYFKRAVFVASETVNAMGFTGKFYSNELDVTYNFYEKEGTLYLSYRNHKNVPLSTVQKDEFGNNDRTLYHFTRNDKNEIYGMLLSCDGSVKEIEFIKN